MQYPVSVYLPQVSKTSVIALRNYRKDVDLPKIIEAVRAETYANQVQAYRKSGIAADKCRLVGFSASGVYSPNHGAEYFKQHNGLMSIDIDRLDTLAEAQDVLSRASRIGFMVAGFVSPSGRGVKLFAAIETEYDLADRAIMGWHRQYWAALSSYVCSELGVQPENQDTKNSNPNRMCFISSDPNAFFNEDPAPINPEELPTALAAPKLDFTRTLSTDAPNVPARRSIFSPETSFDFVCDSVRNHKTNPCDFTPGERHNFTTRIAYMLNRQGVPKNEALRLIRDRFSGESSNIEHHLASVASIYCANSGEFGTSVSVRLQHQSIDRIAGAEEPVQINATADQLETQAETIEDTHTPHVHPISKAALELLTERLFTSENGTPTLPPTNNSGTPPPDYKPDSRILRALYDNEAGDADLLADAFKGKRVYDHTNKVWMTYIGPHWVRDEKKATHADMQRWIVDQYKPVKKALGEIVEHSQDKQTKELYGLAKDRVWQLNGKKRIDNVIDLATKRIGAVTEEFDQHHMLFAFKTSVMDVETGVLLAPNPDLMLTKAVDYDYEPEAETPKFQAFLDTILPDPDVQAFMQRFIGICLTGKIYAQGMLFAYGHGKNGKSTFFALINRLLGSYQVQMQTERFLGRQPNGSSSADYYTVKLKGKRLAVGTEIPTSIVFDEGQIKTLTGGDVISAREIYSQVITFNPTHKLALFGNHKPTIKGADEGIWRRIWLVPFTTMIEEKNRRNQEDLMKELTAELPGIWNWAFEGLKDVQKNGWRVPEVIAAATDEYRADTDSLGEFIGDKLVKDAQGKVLINEAYKVYNEWCQREMVPPVFNSTQSFRKAFQERGYGVIRDRKNKPWLLGFRFSNGSDDPPKPDHTCPIPPKPDPPKPDPPKPIPPKPDPPKPVPPATPANSASPAKHAGRLTKLIDRKPNSPNYRFLDDLDQT